MRKVTALLALRNVNVFAEWFFRKKNHINNNKEWGQQLDYNRLFSGSATHT